MRQVELAALTLTCCLRAAGIFADISDFKVDSYIPDQYQDLRWLVEGNVRLDGSTSSSDPAPAGGTTENSDNSQFILGRTEAAYRFFSIPRFLNADLSLWSQADWNDESSTTEGDHLSFPLPGGSSYFRDTHTDRYSVRIEGDIAAGQYLVSDLFVSPQLAVYFYQDERHTADSRTERIVTDTVAGTVSITRDIDDHHSPRVVRQSDMRLEVGLGYGRVYEGQFAAQALEIIELLKKYALLEKEPTTDDLIGLTQIIYFRRQESPIDVRDQRQVVLNEMADHLANQGLIARDARSAVPLLQDVWDYYDRYARPFGWQVQGNLGFAYSSDRSDYTAVNDAINYRFEYDLAVPSVLDTVSQGRSRSHRHTYYREEYRDFYGEVLASYYRPLSLRWQFNLEAGARYGFLLNEDELRRVFFFNSGPTQVFHDENETSGWLDWFVTPSFRYVFDKRTSLSVTGQVSYIARTTNRYTIGRTSHPSPGYYQYLSIAGDYRITRPTTLRLIFRGEHFDQTYANDDEFERWSYRIDASVQHYLF